MTPLVYFALGDSLSAGKGDPDPDGRPVGWARRMCTIVSAATGAAYTFTNLAVNRATISEVLANQAPAAAAAGPDLISITIGINDIRGSFDPAQFASQVAGLFDVLVGTGATVVTMTIPDIVHLLPLPADMLGAARQIIEMANDGIRESAQHHGVLYLDAYLARDVADPGFWHDDRLHPNMYGHQLIAAATAEVLLAAGPRRGIPPRLPPPAAGVPVPGVPVPGVPVPGVPVPGVPVPGVPIVGVPIVGVPAGVAVPVVPAPAAIQGS
jgi:lysophospholipase L1-like esterase